MVTAIKLFRNGSLKTIEIDKNENLDNLSTCINNGQTNIEELDTIEMLNSNYKILGSTNKHLLMENKHEIPIKYNTIYYGDLIVLKYRNVSMIEDLNLEEYIQLLSI
tara:strand:- start:181 stop:501 length:321 start_codon:yes stop_codon:yes gene_type:complete